MRHPTRADAMAAAPSTYSVPDAQRCVVLCIAETMELANAILAQLCMAGIPLTDIDVMEVCADRPSDLLHPHATVLPPAAGPCYDHDGLLCLPAQARTLMSGVSQTSGRPIIWRVPPGPMVNPTIALEFYELGVAWRDANAIASTVRLGDILILVEVDSRQVCEALTQTCRQTGCRQVISTLSTRPGMPDSPRADQPPAVHPSADLPRDQWPTPDPQDPLHF